MVTATTFALLQRSLVRLISFVSFLAMPPSVLLVLSASVMPAAQPIQLAPVSSASSTVVLFAHDMSDAYHCSAF